MGKRIREDDNIKKLTNNKKYSKELTDLLQGLAVTLKTSERTLWYAIQLYDKYPNLDKVPGSKNITWQKIYNKYFPVPKSEHKKRKTRRWGDGFSYLKLVSPPYRPAYFKNQAMGEPLVTRGASVKKTNKGYKGGV